MSMKFVMLCCCDFFDGFALGVAGAGHEFSEAAVFQDHFFAAVFTLFSGGLRRLVVSRDGLGELACGKTRTSQKFPAAPRSNDNGFSAQLTFFSGLFRF